MNSSFCRRPRDEVRETTARICALRSAKAAPDARIENEEPADGTRHLRLTLHQWTGKKMRNSHYAKAEWSWGAAK
jgi:hypothetical protein